MLRFLGEDGRSEGLIRGGSELGSNGASAPIERRHARQVVFAIRRFGRNGNGRGNGRVGSNGVGPEGELVSERWGPVEELQLELDRSRRFGHPFALVGIWCRPKQREKGTFLREVAGALDRIVRRVDRVWIQGSGVYMLLPECDRTKLEATLERLRGPLARVLGEDSRAEVSSAVFPEDGLTSSALFRTLKGNRDDLTQGPPPRGTSAA